MKTAHAKKPVGGIDEFVGAILRGAATILGCNSANLIVFNAKSREVRVRVGALSARSDQLTSVEKLIGTAINKAVFTLDRIEDSLVYATWRDKVIYETSSFSEMVGSAFPRFLAEKVGGLIEGLRYICVPIVRPTGTLGVMIFTKENVPRFGHQQRGLLLQYAQRVGEIIENEARSRGTELIPESAVASPGTAAAHLLFSCDGKLLGGTQGVSKEGESGNDELIRTMSAAAVRVVSTGDDRLELGPLPVSSLSALLRDNLRTQAFAEFSRISLGDSPAVLCTVVDRRSRSEQSIQSQLVHFALGETAPAILVDTEFRITSCNDATEILTGYGSEQILGEPVEKLFRDGNEIRTILNQQFLFFSQGYFEEVTAVRRRDGKIVRARIKALLLAGENDETIGFLVLMNEEAERGSSPPEADGERLLMRRERLATMGEMAAALAHEIRNPLVAIGATLETMGRDTARFGDAAPILAALTREVTRVDMILQDYLSLSVKRNTTIAPVALGALIEEACRLARSDSEGGESPVTAIVEDGLEVFADGAGLRQVLVNLLRNALEAAPDETVVCRASLCGDFVEISVEDRGPGLLAAPEECFQPFFTTKTNGTGLGLAVCRKIVETHNGSIALENRPEGGCRVVVTLPHKLATR